MSSNPPWIIPSFDYPGANQYNLSQFNQSNSQLQAQGLYTPSWTLEQITAALQADIYNQQRIYDILQVIPNITFDAQVNIPFTGSAADQNIISYLNAFGEPFLICSAQTDTARGKVIIKSQSLSQDLMQNPTLITAIAGQSTAVSPDIAWPQPLLVPPQTVLQFNWYNDTNNPASAGNLTLKGRIIKSTNPNDAPLIQELFNRLMNIPYWIDLAIQYTGSSLETVPTAYNGITNPTIIVGAQTNRPLGTVQPFSQSLSQQVTQNPVPSGAWAYNATSINPIRYFPQPFVVPPQSVMTFNFVNAAGGAAQLAGDLVLVARLLRQQING